MNAKNAALFTIVVALLGASGVLGYRYVGAREDLKRARRNLNSLRQKIRSLKENFHRGKGLKESLRQKVKSLEKALERKENLVVTLNQRIENLRGRLNVAENTAFRLRGSLQSKENLVGVLRRRTENLKRRLKAAENRVSRLRDILQSTKSELAAVRLKLREVKEGNRLRLHNPSYSEVQSFIERDPTDRKEYAKEKSVCTDYVASLNNNAEENGIRAGVVSIRFEEKGHTIVAFQTVNKGLIYVEPQLDIIITSDLGVGQEYYKVLDESSEMQVKSPAINDVIRRIIISW